MNEIIEWINLNIDNSQDILNSNNIPNIFAFTLLWNLYEDLFWTRNTDNTNNQAYSLRKALEIIESKKDKFDESVITPIFCYYHTRYQELSKFENLKFRDSGADREAKEKIELMLNSTIQHSISNKLYFIMAIVFRFRNNLFHGEKQLIHIQYQEENFKYANQFLMHIIEKSKEDL